LSWGQCSHTSPLKKSCRLSAWARSCAWMKAS
jgi:hypothetical protein